MELGIAKRVFCLVCVLALATAGPPVARGSHETIIIDGNLADLIAAVGRNSGPAQGGFAVPDVMGDVYTVKCPQFVNGYDIKNYYVFLDFKNPDGSIASNPTLYAGWEAFGVIGDVDGNGDATTYNPLGPHGGCALSDERNIGPFESYRIFIRFCATGLAGIVIKDVDGDGTVEVQLNNANIPGAQVAFSGSGLELKIPNLRTLFPNADLCNLEFIMRANSQNDGLGEDFNDTPIVLDVRPSVKISKTPTKQGACPDRTVGWTIDVANDGLCPLQSVTVRDTLDVGMTYTSSNPSRTSGNNQVSVWQFPTANLGPGQSLAPITLQARTAIGCSGDLENLVWVEGMHVPPSGCTTAHGAARDSASATVSCAGPICSITQTPPGKVIEGTRVDLCGPPGNFTYRWTLPDGSIRTTRCVTLDTVRVSDEGLYRLTITDAAQCSSVCNPHFLDVNPPGEECTITGPDSLCTGEPLTLCGQPVGTNFSYRWTLPDLTQRVTTDPCLTLATPDPGIYSLVVRDQNSGRETGPCTHRFKVNKRPPCAISAAPTVVTVGGPLELCGPIGNFSYQWTLPNRSIQTGRCVNIASVALSDTGLYTLVVTDRVTRCESVPCSYRLVLGEPFKCVITGPEKVDAGTPVELCGPEGNFTYQWKLPDLSTRTGRCLVFPSVQTSDEGDYTLTVTNKSGESRTCTRKLSVNQKQPPDCKNCPRSADFWARECDARHAGGGKYSPDQLQKIAECVDGLSSFFNWGGPAPGGPLIAKRSEWKFHDEGIDLGTSWRGQAFSDAAWKSGRGVLGYGEDYVTTTVSYGPSSSNKHPTTYFRRTFDVADVTAIKGLMLRVMYDDGVVVYLNGVEVARRSMPAGPVTYRTWAHNHEADNTYESVDLGAFMGLLKNGSNLLAAEVHQVDAGSSDLIFDAELVDQTWGGLPARRSTWKYHDLGQDLGTSWRNVGYSDASWSSGPGVLGYGESYVTTTVSYGPSSSNKYVTTYFRHTFDLTGAAGIGGLTLHLMYDDGAIVYLNGVEIARRHMPSGAVNYLTLASNHEADNSYVAIDVSAHVGLLVHGANVLAAEVHQADRSSSDLVFDAALEARGTVANLTIAAAGMAFPRPGPGILGVDAVNGFCETVADVPKKDDRGEAKRQFAALLANICASNQAPQSGDPVCLDPNTEVDCKYFTAKTIAELIVEVDARLAQLEGRRLDDIEEEYERIVDCLNEINNGWGIPVSKDCEDDDKKGRRTPAGLNVAVGLGPGVTVVFDEVTVEGTTFIAYGPCGGLPGGLQAVDGQAIDLTSTASYAGGIRISVGYDETALQVPEQELKLLRFDPVTQMWNGITTSLDPVLNRIEGACDGLSTYAVVAPPVALSADGPGDLMFGLRATSPNPTSGRATIGYTLTRGGSVRLTVHDVQGRQVALLAEGRREAGNHSVVWSGRAADGRKLASGIYVIRLEAKEGLRTGKLVIVN